jgi:hypothetical protein
MLFKTYLLYIDPGSGSMLIQLIIASFLSVISFSKKAKLFIVSLFRKPSRKQE